jgi:sulfane dehydrogenase subunit SoxC
MIEPTAMAVTREELQLATRNHGMPLEALHHPITPFGLHYLLIHYDIPALELSGWHLRVEGEVAQPLDLTMDDLRSMAPATHAVTMECAGNGRALLEPRAPSVPWLVEAVGTAEWTGAPLATVLAEAKATSEAVAVVFTGADRGVEGGIEQSYQRSLPVATAMTADAVLAYEINGIALPPQHGFPLRLVVPGWYGMANVKWLTTITVQREPFDGYQESQAYRMKQSPEESGEPVMRILPRSLMAPPGIPDFFTRRRLVPAGECELTGRAWSGHGAIVAVDVSTDGGVTWHAADVGARSLGPYAWQHWHSSWSAEPGDHELCCRATDDAGNQQPLDPQWNVGGFTNNAVHRLAVRVE